MVFGYSYDNGFICLILEVSPQKALHNLKCVGLKSPPGKSYEYPTYSSFVVDIFLGTCQFAIKDDNGGLDVMP